MIQIEPESTLAPFISYDEGAKEISFDGSDDSISALVGNSYSIGIRLISTDGDETVYS